METKFKSFPDLSTGLQRMRIQDDLMDISPDHSILGLSIRQALDSKKSLNLIMDTILASYDDNKEAVTDIVGLGTMNRILKLNKRPSHDY